MAEELRRPVSGSNVHLDGLQKVPALKTRLEVEGSVGFTGKSGVLRGTSASADA